MRERHVSARTIQRWVLKLEALGQVEAIRHGTAPSWSASAFSIRRPFISDDKCRPIPLRKGDAVPAEVPIFG